MELGSLSEAKLNTKLGSCSPQHQLANIYRSYNDIDTLSSGSFDFGQNQLLATAPEADWLYHVSDRFPDRPHTVAEQPQNLFGNQWEPQSTSTPSFQGQPDKLQQQNSHNPAQFGSHDESARFRTLPYSRSSPMAARQGVSQCLASQRMVNPFAKYASIAPSGPLLSADLDTARPANGQLPVQPHQDSSNHEKASGKQHELLPPAGSFAMQ